MDIKIYECNICHNYFSSINLYEYRNGIACSGCHSKLIEKLDMERAELIEDSEHRTNRFRGLDLSGSQIGSANREILRKEIKIAKKESKRRKDYETRR